MKRIAILGVCLIGLFLSAGFDSSVTKATPTFQEDLISVQADFSDSISVVSVAPAVDAETFGIFSLDAVDLGSPADAANTLLIARRSEKHLAYLKAPPRCRC